ncbi:MAG TPA: peptidoglycan DD-metalloendopeptidase family protein [Roseiflexaceae bacterium]|nr:peptidoglycan DD-metalloendopeptidase family protein [Roseiflexaceae bacterium]
MDLSPRQRYRARRQSIEARRRRVALAISGVLLLGLVIGLAYRRPAARQPAQPAAPAARVPTAVAPAATAVRGAISAPTAVANQPAAAPALEPTPAPAAPAAFFDERRLIYEPGLYAPQIQALLDAQPGPLKTIVFQIGDRRHSFAEALTGQTSYYSVNPKVILALIELQSRLLSTAGPSADQVGWALGYQGENGNKRGLQAQMRWVVRQILFAKRDYPQRAPLTYADNSSAPAPDAWSLSEYVIARALAPTTSPDRLPGLLQRFLETYTRLFGDPRTPPEGWPAPSAPFLSWPIEHSAPVTSFFDHGGPFLTRNAQAGIVTYWGRTETDLAFAYNGHDGWDYAAAPPDLALAAADGEVVFAGNADDNCNTRSVIVDHGNGYRTMYWHLARVDVAIGDHVARGQPVGMIGQSGCATGPHLHFGVQFLGRNTDPYGWCGAGPDPWATNPAGIASQWLWIDRPSPCGAPWPGAIVVDTDSAGFAKDGDGWQSAPSGYGGSALFVASLRGDDDAPWDLRPLARPAIAVWRPALPAAGRYRVLAYVPYALSGLEDATEVRYRVRYSGGEADVVVNGSNAANDWVDLGTYAFDPSDNPSVALSNVVEAEQRGVWADAVIWLPAEGP